MRKTERPETFEQTLMRLEELVKTMEAGNMPLQEMLKTYEEGMSLSNTLKKQLNDAKGRLMELNAKGETSVSDAAGQSCE